MKAFHFILLGITVATTHHVFAEKNFLRGLPRMVGNKEVHEKDLSDKDLIVSYDRNIQDANTRLLESDEDNRFLSYPSVKTDDDDDNDDDDNDDDDDELDDDC
jgi:hypothetical protein